MRVTALRDFLNHLDENASKPTARQLVNNDVYTISNLDRFRGLLAEIKNFPGLSKLAEEMVEKMPFLTRTEDQLRLSGDEWRSVSSLLAHLGIALGNVREILNAATPAPTEDGLRIRLPDDAHYHQVINDLAKIFKILEQALLDPSTDNPEMAAQIRLDGWENGSFWIQVSVGSVYLVSLIGSIAWAAAVVRRKWAEGTIMVEKAKEIGAEASAVEHLSNKLRASIDVVIDTEAKNVLATHGRGRTGAEYVERLKYSIRELYEMISRGAEIHPALMEPTKASDVFPDFAKLNTIGSKVRELPANTVEATEPETPPA